MKIFKAAIVGLGFVGRSHLDALRRRGIPVVGLLGSSPDRTHEASQGHGIGKAYSSLAELAGDPEVDVAHICTPNRFHFEQAQALLAAGKHVICEKPLAMDTKQSSALVRLAREHQRVGAVAYNLRYYPLCQEARSMVERGLIGEPRLIHGGFLQDWLLYPRDWNWRLEKEEGGDLRAAADIGTHWMDLVTWLTGRRITELCADLATVVPVRQKPRGRVESFQASAAAASDQVTITTDDYASVLFRFEGAVRGVMTVSQVSAGRKCSLGFEINGSEASLAWNAESPNTLWIGRRNQPNEEMPKDPSLMSPQARGYAAYPGGHQEGYPDTFAQFFKDVYAYLAAGDLKSARTFPTFENGHDEIALCEAIADSGRERRWVSMANPK